MLLIICFHYVYKTQYQIQTLNFDTVLVKSIWFFGELGVNAFILITGYYLCNSKATLKKVILLIIEVLFYNFLLYIIGSNVGYNFNTNTIIEKANMLFPIITKRYWFITVYLLVYILSPFYNKLIESFDKRNFQKFILINFILWSMIPTIFGLIYNNTEGIIYYNRFIWLSFMYFVGAYIRKYNIKCLSSKKGSLLTTLITFAIMIASIIVIHLFKEKFMIIGTSETAYFWTPNNILMFILSISFFKFFTELKIKSNKFINKISSATLGIYLLHDGCLAPYIFTNIFNNNIKVYTDNAIVHILIATSIIFITGVIIELIRQSIEKYTIKKIINLNIWNSLYNKLKSTTIYLIDRFI
jgi:surface polysaccharide O-acyltransferase-like enzyme